MLSRATSAQCFSPKCFGWRAWKILRNLRLEFRYVLRASCVNFTERKTRPGPERSERKPYRPFVQIPSGRLHSCLTSMAKKKQRKPSPPKAKGSVILSANRHQRTYTIADYRLEKPDFSLRQVRVGDTIRYEVKGD